MDGGVIVTLILAGDVVLVPSVTVNVSPSLVKPVVVELKLTRPPSISAWVNVPLTLSAVPSTRISPCVGSAVTL